MKDLRDQTHQQPDRPPTADEQVFLDYHNNSPWAQEKVKQPGAFLFPESVAYMQRELAERKRAAAAYQAQLEKDNAAQQLPETPAPEPVAGSEPSPDGVGGLPGAGHQGG